MKNYYEKLQTHVDKYKNKYAQHPKKAAWKLALWNLKCVFKNHKVVENAQTKLKDIFPKISNDVLKIAIAEGGGMGDAIFQTTYIKEIRKLFKLPVIIDFYCRSPQVFQNFPFIDNCFMYSDNHQMDDYDVYIISRRFYIIGKINTEKTKCFSRFFYDFCMDCKNLTDNILCGQYDDNLFSQYALIFKKNRLEQANVHGILNVDRNTPKYMQWDENAFNILETYKLSDQKYITVSRACSSKYGDTHPKLWPLEYYNSLIQTIKSAFPEIKIIQIGENSGYGDIHGVDIDLRGKTSIDETKCVLKYAFLHIDGEGGLVHLRNTLNGKSLVLFGPTSPEIFGYNENVNLRSSICPICCEWVTPHWTKQCLYTKNSHTCMKSLLPQTVFEAFNEVLNNEKLWKYRVQSLDNVNSSLFFNKKIAHVLYSKLVIFEGGDVTIYDKQPLDIKEDNIRAEFATPYNIPSPCENFDIVYCDRFTKISHPLYALNEFLRILKENGKCIISSSSDIVNELAKRFDIKNQNSPYLLITKERG